MTANEPPPLVPPPGGAGQVGFREVVLSIERHIAEAGWDQPVRLYALADTAELAQQVPELAGSGETAYTAVEQEDLPAHSSLEELLARLAWPPNVLGAAVAAERVMLSPDLEGQIPGDEAAALRWVAEHPRRQDVRLVVGVLRGGPRECAIRLRSHDSDAEVLVGRDLVPALADALAATFE